MSKKVIFEIILIILAGIIVISVNGIKLDETYSETTKLYVYIGKNFEGEDIKQIAKEVFETNKVTVQKVEAYEDMTCIGLNKQELNKIAEGKEKNEEDYLKEQLEILNTKINEKYELENKTDNIEIQDESNIKIFDIIKPYILLFTISSVIIVACMLIIIRKSVLNIIATYILTICGGEVLYAFILSVTRLPFNRFSISIGLIIYILAVVVSTILIQKQLKNIEAE